MPLPVGLLPLRTDGSGSTKPPPTIGEEHRVAGKKGGVEAFESGHGGAGSGSTKSASTSDLQSDDV